MKRKIFGGISALMAALLLLVANSFAQELAIKPDLPFENAETPDKRARLGTNGFPATPTMVGGIHSDRIRVPDIDIPELPPRIYLTARFYGCRPWFVHPYTGAAITKAQLIRSVWTDCPAWPNATIDDLLKPSDALGGVAPLEIIDGGLVDQDNPDAVQEFQEEIAVEQANAAAVDINLGNQPNHIIHAPYWGLYCLKIRICLPYDRAAHANKAYRFFVRFPYQLHQRWCWSRWWWHRPIAVTGGGFRPYPYRPVCIPHTYWTRSGPDWVWNVTNSNRYRHWCLYGLRYFCIRWQALSLQRPKIPLLGALDENLNPDAIFNADGQTPATDGWVRPWPYPTAHRYWPYRPYCTRWYWFRPLPWIAYRHFPPVIQCAFAVPKPQFGSGFVPGPDLNQTGPFPADPPNLGIDSLRGFGAQGIVAQGAAGFDSFFDIDVECRGRAVEQHNGDLNGNGFFDSGDNNRLLRRQLGDDFGDDINDMDFRVN